ncbi:MAG: type II secretion system protein [Sedimentisphaerales bacterium]|nr:type II secretion system protein [Sedimentisphaerales bacterium]
MNYKLNRAFTITELMIAVAMMAVVLAGTGYIFKVAINAQRTANATTEIMRNLRGITDQLENDFSGRRTDAPWAVSFDTDSTRRADRIRFVASGDFQSVRQYTASNKTISGNVASICYSQSSDPNVFTGEPRKKILTRRQSIFTVDTSLASPAPEPNEYIRQSLTQWEVDFLVARAAAADVNTFYDKWVARPTINPNNVGDVNVPLFMARGVDNFTIQISSGVDPNGSGSLLWEPTNQQVILKQNPSGNPQAIKFMFTLYDSKGIIKNGMKFTHIVYLKQ